MSDILNDSSEECKQFKSNNLKQALALLQLNIDAISQHLDKVNNFIIRAEDACARTDPRANNYSDNSGSKLN